MKRLNKNSVDLKIGLIGEPTYNFKRYLLIDSKSDYFVNIKDREDPHKFLALTKSTATIPGKSSNVD